MNREEMNDQEFEAFTRAAISSGKNVILELNMAGYNEIAKILYTKMKEIESNPKIAFQDGGLTFLDYNGVEPQAIRVAEAVDLKDRVEAVEIHAQRVAEALDVEEPVPPMADSPRMIFSQGLELPALAIESQRLRAQPQASYHGATPR